MECRNTSGISIRQSTDERFKDTDEYAYIDMVVSSDELDTYGTRFDEGALRHLAEQLNNNAIQLKDSHDRTQGFGVSEFGEYRDGKVYGTFKVLKNWDLNNASFISSNQFLDGIRHGLITGNSIGFLGDEYICNLCDDDFFSRSCNHYPKKDYELKDSDGNKEIRTCEVIMSGKPVFIETSLVDSPANPSAKIIEKAKRSFQDGTLPSDVQYKYETQYNVRFSGQEINKSNGGPNVDNKDLEQQLTDAKEARTTAEKELTELKPLAECGKAARAYMADQVKEAYKVSRGEKLQESELEAVEGRSSKMTFKELVTELEYLRTLAPADPKVEPGSKTSQPDNSGNRSDESDEDEKIIVNPAHWGVRFN